jgi:hypothetical protein
LTDPLPIRTGISSMAIHDLQEQADRLAALKDKVQALRRFL